MNHDVLSSTCSLLQNANLFDANQGQIVNFHNILLYVHSRAIYSTVTFSKIILRFFKHKLYKQFRHT